MLLAGHRPGSPGTVPSPPREDEAVPSPLHPCVSPSSAVDALQAMLLRGGNEDVVQRVELEGGWQLLRTSAGHEEGVARLARFSLGHVWGPGTPQGHVGAGGPSVEEQACPLCSSAWLGASPGRVEVGRPPRKLCGLAVLMISGRGRGPLWRPGEVG